jgi:hypothetical protein
MFFSWRRGGSRTQAWMPTYVRILRVPPMIWVWRATVEWYIDRGKPKNSERNLSQCHLVHQKSHMDWPGLEPGPPRWEAGDQRPEPKNEMLRKWGLRWRIEFIWLNTETGGGLLWTLTNLRVPCKMGNSLTRWAYSQLLNDPASLNQFSYLWK